MQTKVAILDMSIEGDMLEAEKILSTKNVVKQEIVMMPNMVITYAD